VSLWFRLLVVGAVLGLALLIAWLSRRGIAVRRHRASFPNGLAGPVLFTSETCPTCDRMRKVIAELELKGFREVVWEHEAGEFESAGVDRVPALMWSDRHGATWRVDGVVGAARLRRWIGGP